MPKVLITGGTGMVGRYLISLLKEKGFEVNILSRKKSSSPALPKGEGERSNDFEIYQWNIEKKFIEEEAIANADYIIHLAGANIGEKRWTEKRKKEILDSRVESSDLLYEYLGKIKNNVKAVISASGVGIYGNGMPHPLLSPKEREEEGEGSKEKIFSESDSPANDFLAQTCKQWENAVNKISTLGKRGVIFRFGIVLAKEAEILKKLELPIRFFVAPVFGNGEQFISWIHIQDLCRIILKAMEEEKMNGVYNAVAPLPVRNKELVAALAQTLLRPTIKISIPKFLLKIGLGEMANALLDSQNVSAEKIMKEGFEFNFPNINEALVNLLRK